MKGDLELLREFGRGLDWRRSGCRPKGKHGDGAWLLEPATVRDLLIGGLLRVRDDPLGHGPVPERLVYQIGPG